MKSLNENPLISIITSTFNASAYIKKTIESINSNNDIAIEWIIVDGNSNDNTVELIQKFCSINFKIICEEDDGIYDAWNKGLSLSRGSWVTFIGAGDEFIPEGLKIYTEYIIQEHYHYDFISSRVELLDEKGKLVKIIGSPFSYKAHKKYMNIAHVGSIHKKSLFSKYGNFDKKYLIAGDYEFFMRCGSSLRSGFINKVTARMIAGGVSNGYKAIIETYIIQNNYSKNKIIPILNLYISLIKYLYRLLKIKN
jgi:glycosyltransferase involved in cell wall biosynthesis